MHHSVHSVHIQPIHHRALRPRPNPKHPMGPHRNLPLVHLHLQLPRPHRAQAQLSGSAAQRYMVPGLAVRIWEAMARLMRTARFWER